MCFNKTKFNNLVLRITPPKHTVFNIYNYNMPKGKHVPQSIIDEVLEKVALYQSEQKSSVKHSFEVIGDEYGIKPDTISKWYYKTRGKNRVISQVAKKKDKISKKIAAVSVSSSAQLDAEKIIFDYLKGLSTFKRILACICGFDKLCMHYGCKKMDK